MPEMTLEQALQLAIQYHQSGRMAEAESIYRQILSLQPAHADAMHLLGVLLHQHGRHAEAEQMIRRAISLSPAAEYYSNLAAVLEAQGRKADALGAHEKALAINPNSAPAHSTYGTLLQQSGRLDEAEAEFRKAISLQPQFADAHLNLGNLMHLRGQHEAALGEYQLALSHRPDYADAQLNAGVSLWKLGRLDEAAVAFGRAIAMRPNYPEAYLHQALLFEQQGRTTDAIRAVRQALAHRPDYPEALATLGNVLKAEGKLDDSIAAYRESLRLRPDSAEVLSSMGAALQEHDDLEQAIATQERAIALRPDLAEAYVNLATAYREAGRFDDALAACQKSLAIRPGYREAEWNLGLGKLLAGDLRAGWELYESRFGVRGLIPPRQFRQPLWDGSPLDGRRILLHAEQGFGDTIQFVRYAPLVKARGGVVLLQCQSQLRRLLAGQSAIDVLLTESDPLPDFDVHCPLLSVPRIFGTTIETIPSDVPYLTADPQLVERWRLQLAAQARRLKVGLVWAGRETHKNDRNRSMQLSDLAPPIERFVGRGVGFYSLQKGGPAAQLRTAPVGARIIDHTDELADFADTAALITNLDLVIAVDTAVAHLAGAIAKPVCLLLPLSPDWRWMLNRNDSPWYPTMKLFRQTERRNWQHPLDAIARELERLT